MLGTSFLDELPARLIGDKACDSDALDTQLRAKYDIKLIALNRRPGAEPKTDGLCGATAGTGK